MTNVALDRRHFLRVTIIAGGGMLVGFHIPNTEAASIQAKPWTAPPRGAEINA